MGLHNYPLVHTWNWLNSILMMSNSSKIVFPSVIVKHSCDIQLCHGNESYSWYSD
jgi:hypothetical protein